MKKSMYTIFQEEALYWQKYFGLNEWKVFFDYKKLPSHLRADILLNFDGAAVTIRLNKDWTKKEEIEVRESAFHEVCHMLISDLDFYNSHKDSEMQGHKVIRKLENSVFLNDVMTRYPNLSQITKNP